MEERIRRLERLVMSIIRQTGIKSYYSNTDIEAIRHTDAKQSTLIDENSDCVLDVASLADENSLAIEELAEIVDELSSREE